MRLIDIFHKVGSEKSEYPLSSYTHIPGKDVIP